MRPLDSLALSRGTVDRITLRSVQLRHQNGPVHPVPFGTIGQITNFSRDWATMKFTIRLDRDADIEKARKTIKRVGQQMLEDPETALYRTVCEAELLSTPCVPPSELVKMQLNVVEPALLSSELPLSQRPPKKTLFTRS